MFLSVFCLNTVYHKADNNQITCNTSHFRVLWFHSPDQLFLGIQDVEQLVGVDFLWSREENNLKWEQAASINV